MPLQVELGPRSRSEMIGDFCRELAVLILVFVPLELYRASGVAQWVIYVSIIGSIGLLALGITIERSRT